VLVALGFMVALVVIGHRYMQVQSFQKSASLRLSMTYVYAVIPIAAAIMAWYALVDLLELLIQGPDAPRDDDKGGSGTAEEPLP